MRVNHHSEPVLMVLRKHFPGEKRLHIEGAELFWNELTLTHGPYVHGVDPVEQERHLRDLEKGLRLAARAIDALDIPVLVQLETVYKQNAKARVPQASRLVTTDQVGSKQVPVEARDLIQRLHAGVLGEWPFAFAPDVQQVNAIAAARQLIGQLPKESAQARRSHTWTKVILTEKARLLWKELSGKDAPRKKLNPATPFALFLADLIAAIGEDWEPESTFRAWASRAKMDS